MRPFRVKHEGKEYLFSNRPGTDEVRKHIGCDIREVNLEELSFAEMEKYGFFKVSPIRHLTDVERINSDYVRATFSNPNESDSIPFEIWVNMKRDRFWMIQMMKIALYCGLDVKFYGEDEQCVDWCNEYMERE